MSVPDYETFMLPVLAALSDGQARRRKEVIDLAADALGLTAEDRLELISSGKMLLYVSRGSWSLSYLTQAGALMRPERGVYQITERGSDLLSRGLDRVDNSILEEFEEFRNFRNRSNTSDGADDRQSSRIMTGSPEELLEGAYQVLRAELASQLIDSLKDVDPSRFEVIVVDVLQAMGYGRGRKGAARVVGQVGDGGIDGVIDEDQLGLDVIYVQAKRWEANVGRPQVQAFVGAIHGNGARKGVMITTAGYTNEAIEYVRGLPTKVVLIDGERLAELMIDHGVGVSVDIVYKVNKLDSDYFED